jgi:hypothetical protein
LNIVVVERMIRPLQGQIIRNKKTSNSLQPRALACEQTRRLWLTGLPRRRFISAPNSSVHRSNNQRDDCLSDKQG